MPVIEDRIIPFAASTAAENQHAFSVSRTKTTQEIAQIIWSSRVFQNGIEKRVLATSGDATAAAAVTSAATTSGAR